MNVLIDGVTPKVCSLKEVLRAFLDHRRDVLVRRTTFRVEKIDHRLEVLEGLIIAFLNLDRVIDIIRYDDDPKLALMAENWQIDHVRATSEADYVGPDTGAKGNDRGPSRSHFEHAIALFAASGRNGIGARTRCINGRTRRP